MTNRTMPVCVALLIAAGAALVHAQAPPPFPAAKLEKIERAISAEMARNTIPGLSAAVVADHQLRWSNGYGFADLENFVPAKAVTVYRLASVSKPITAAAVMQLVEGGKLDLDAPIQTYVPSFPQKPWPLTARQLLGHLAGVRHYKADEVSNTRRYATLTAGLAIFKDDPLLFEPGTKYAYTTYGYNLLGCAVEGAAGMKFVDYVRDRIFRQAQMERIRDDDAQAVVPNRAQGYVKMPNGDLRNSNLADTSYKIPGGGLCGTAEDLARFAIAMQTNVLLKKETVAEMWTPQKLRAGAPTTYGLGWQITSRGGRQEVAHGGAQQRVSTYLYMLPNEKCAVALMCNLEGAGAALSRLARQIADAALE